MEDLFIGHQFWMVLTMTIGNQEFDFLKSLDNKAWKAVLTGWVHHVVTKEGEATTGRKARTDEKPKEGKEVQCYECDGYGHIRTEYGTYLKKQKMSLAATWSDESDTEEAANLVTALTGRWESDEDSSDGEVTFEELASTYRKLCHKSVELCKQLDKNPQAENQKIAQLESEKADHAKIISKLKTEVMFQNSKLEEMTKYVRMLSNGFDSLDKILQIGQITGDKSGIGYNNSKPGSSDTGVKPQAKLKCIQKTVMSHNMSQHQRRKQLKGKHQIWRCHYCGKFGHLKPFCYKLYGYPRSAHHQDHHQFRPKHHMPIIKKQWVPKTNVTSLIAHSPLRISAKEEWYFDSGCSRHMTGNQDLLTDLHQHTISHVTFGDGAKGEIKGTGKLDCLGVPRLNKVLLVKGLTANLISISQLCDQGLNVNFTKTECQILDIKSEVIMRGIRTKDNCYIWSSQLDCPLKYWVSTNALKSDEKQGWGKCHIKMSHQKTKGEKDMIAQKTERVDQTGGHLTSHRENGTFGTKPQRTLCKKAKDDMEKIWVTPVKVLLMPVM
ncbi:hypothetical protein KIW84_013178 [Lathyrus oleraceus]|uniref:Retrovirus-related Pol polyprotein from transposon TNT 1-94-like beta-barrel domain-containing protein n=1 Tax=Pisum sativum TaxID=3888 RepID=A0A9D5GXM4_PEA|nr:hypothetical protein KIW84_013178 [Pisum sativum]